MEQYKCKLLFRNLVKFVSRGYSQRYLDNPLELFERDRNSGKYNDMPQKQYDHLAKEVAQESLFWNSLRNRSVIELLKTALENIDFTEEQLDGISDILSTAYENTDHDSIPASIVQRGAMPDPAMIYGATADKETDALYDNTTPYDDTPPYDDTDEDENICNPALFQNPKQIYNYLSGGVYGQDQAKREAAILLWNHMRGIKQNMLFAGPTGCGKTEIFRQLQKIYPYIAIYDANSLTGEGWKGNMKIRNLFDGFSREQAEQLIIVLDEADKLFEKNVSYIGGGTVVQNELLKIMEGDMVHFEGDPQHPKAVPTLELDTSNISFVFLGSFETMLKSKNSARPQNIGFLSDASENGKETDYHSIFTSQDLVKYANIRQEIAGRITKIVQLQPLMQEDFLSILNDANMSPIKKLEEAYHVTIHMEEYSKRKLSQEAEENKMGVRYIKSRLQTLLNEALFQDCEKGEYLLQ